LLGTDSRDLFISTSCIRQNEVTDILSGRKEIGESLEGKVTGGTGDTVASQVIEKLTKRINSLKKGSEKLTITPGPIAGLTQQINGLQKELTHIKEEVAKVEQQKITLVAVSYELDQMEAKLAEAVAILDKNKRRQQIEETISKLNKDHEKIDALVQDIGLLNEQIQKSELELRAIEGFDDMHKVQEIKDSIPGLEANRKNIETDLPKRRLDLDTAKEYFKKNRFLAAVGSRTGLIVGAVISVAGFLGMLLNTASLAAGIIGLLFLVIAMWGRSSLAQHRTQTSDLQGRIGRMEKTLTEIEEEEHNIFSQVNCRSVEEFWQKEQKYSELVARKNDSQNQLVGKLGKQTFEQIEQERRNIARVIAVEQEKITDDLKNTKVSPEEYIKLEKAVEYLGNKKKQLEFRKIESEVGIKNSKYDSEGQAQLEEKLESLTNDLKREQRRVRVYELAKDFVSKARDETLVSAKDILQSQIQKNFEIFTNGKYKRVIFDEKSMDFHIYSEEKGDWANPDELSGGVVDELYLACRLALVHLIYGKTQPPLILDDPFTNFDQPRLARTLEFFKQLSHEHQIIIFTLSDAYDNIADRVIDLK
jgi:uncharacterized protein YhaN